MLPPKENSPRGYKPGMGAKYGRTYGLNKDIEGPAAGNASPGFWQMLGLAPSLRKPALQNMPSAAKMDEKTRALLERNKSAKVKDIAKMIVKNEALRKQLKLRRKEDAIKFTKQLVGGKWAERGQMLKDLKKLDNKHMEGLPELKGKVQPKVYRNAMRGFIGKDLLGKSKYDQFKNT